MTESLPALIGAAQTHAPFDAEVAAAELVIDLPADADHGLLWLTLAAHRAGMGLPPFPLRARGWLTFGTPVEAHQGVAIGDVALVAAKGGEVAGIVVGTMRGLQIACGPDEVLRVRRNALIAARRPIILTSENED